MNEIYAVAFELFYNNILIEILLSKMFADSSETRNQCPPLRSSQAPNLDVDKLFEEIMLDIPNYSDYRPSVVHSPQKKEDVHLRSAISQLCV